jgi:4-alpha-glucanotransferase
MNTPATGEDNWQWRFRDGDLTEELARRLREMTELFGRIDPKR